MPATPEPLPHLPETADALRTLLLAAWAERDGAVIERDNAVAERDALAVQNDRLRHLLLKLQRMQFGAKSERLPEEQRHARPGSPRAGHRPGRGQGGAERSRAEAGADG